MLKKVLEYAGDYRKKTYQAIATMLIGVGMNILPFLFIYQIITPLIMHQQISTHYIIFRVIAIAISLILYAVFYVKGLALSHQSAYHTLKNLRISLQCKLEKQPLGVIQEKGVGAHKKTFIDDIEAIELLLAHALPEGISNLAIPLFIYIVMFIVDWKLALLSLGSLPIGLLAMGAMFKRNE